MIDIEKIAYLKAMGIELWCRRDVPLDDQENNVAIMPEKSSVQSFDWNQFQQEVHQCVACEICKARKNVVFGYGNVNADIMIIGEAPGASEDEQGKPFVGRAGQLLTNMLLSIGIDREQVYITNILKCRPPNNRDPLPNEVKNCMPFLEKQMKQIAPKAIITLGRIAAQTLLETDQTMGHLREKVYEYGERKTPFIPMYHPAYLLRSPSQKGKAYEDLLLIKRVLEKVTHG